MPSKVIVLYDADCGFCRWAMAWAVRHDHQHALVAAPIQSPLGAALLADVPASERLREAHVIHDGHSRRSGGAAAADVLSTLPATRALGRLGHRLPHTTALLYRVLAARRASFGRLVGREARRRADDLLRASRLTTPAELEASTRQPSQA